MVSKLCYDAEQKVFFIQVTTGSQITGDEAGRDPAAELADYSPHGRLAPGPETASADALQTEPEALALEQTADATGKETGRAGAEMASPGSGAADVEEDITDTGFGSLEPAYSRKCYTVWLGDKERGIPSSSDIGPWEGSLYICPSGIWGMVGGELTELLAIT